MTQLLERAFAEVSRFPERDQDAMAALLLAELESDRQWAQSFVSSQEELAHLAHLAHLADEALREFAAGETLPVDLNRDFPNH